MKEHDPVLPQFRPVYLTPGRSESCGGCTIGAVLSEMDIGFTGRDLSEKSPFAMLPFAAQVVAIRDDIAALTPAAPVLIGHSWGAYLLLYALMEKAPPRYGLMLVSPILGITLPKANFLCGAIPPRAGRIQKYLRANIMRLPEQTVIYAGSRDTQVDFQAIEELASLTPGCRVNVLPDQQHPLSRDAVRRILAELTTSYL